MKEKNKPNHCAYPECTAKDWMKVKMPVGEMQSDGQIDFPHLDRVKSECILCEYHARLAEKGILQLINQDGIIVLVSPKEIISLIEKMFEVFEEIKGGKK